MLGCPARAEGRRAASLWQRTVVLRRISGRPMRQTASSPFAESPIRHGAAVRRRRRAGVAVIRVPGRSHAIELGSAPSAGCSQTHPRGWQGFQPTRSPWFWPGCPGPARDAPNNSRSDRAGQPLQANCSRQAQARGRTWPRSRPRCAGRLSAGCGPVGGRRGPDEARFVDARLRRFRVVNPRANAIHPEHDKYGNRALLDWPRPIGGRSRPAAATDTRCHRRGGLAGGPTAAARADLCRQHPVAPGISDRHCGPSGKPRPASDRSPALPHLLSRVRFPTASGCGATMLTKRTHP